MAYLVYQGLVGVIAETDRLVDLLRLKRDDLIHGRWQEEEVGKRLHPGPVGYLPQQ